MEKTVIFCVGVPASGKSTWSKKHVEENKYFVRVCRDDYRYMYKNVGWFDDEIRGRLENLITMNVESDILNLLNNDLNVLIDETNLNQKRLKNMLKIIHKIDPEIELKFKIFDVDKEELLVRDSNRDRSVGEKVINTMYNKYEDMIKNFDFELYGEII